LEKKDILTKAKDIQNSNQKQKSAKMERFLSKIKDMPRF